MNPYSPIERDYTTANWIKKGLLKLEQQLQQLMSKKTNLSKDEKFLKIFLQELAEQHKSRKSKAWIV